MSIAPKPSVVVLPEFQAGCATIADFLMRKFTAIDRETWLRRLASGKVTDEDHTTVTADAPYVPLKRIHYYREVEYEAPVPCKEDVLYQDDHLLVACKPHFLPVIPAGRYVTESLLYRLKQSSGIDCLSPIHRIDRHTAGLVLFSTNQRTRGAYQALFMRKNVEKEYEAIASRPEKNDRKEWVIRSRIVRGEPWFRMKIVDGPVNAGTVIRLIETRGDTARFRCYPRTGKKHQIRLHLGALGCRIVNDRCYPALLPEKEDDFSRPLALLAKRIAFTDPVNGKKREFISARELAW